MNGCTFIVADAWLLAGLGSRSSLDTVARFVTDMPATALLVCVRIVTDALPPEGTVPTLHVTVPFSLSHPGVASMKSMPAGSGSLIVTPVASLGPALLAVSV